MTIHVPTTVHAQVRFSTQNESNDEGYVACATASVVVYKERDTVSEEIGRIMKNQIVRITDEVGDFYAIAVGNDKGWVQSSYFVSGNELLEYVQEHPSWFPQTVKITKDSNYFSMETNSVAGTVHPGEEYQMYKDDEVYYVAIQSILDADNNEVNTLIAIPKEAGSIVYKVPVISLKETEYSAEQASIVEYACSFVGCAYVWGGTNPTTGVDCSGFVKYVYKHFGYDIPRVSADQAEFGTRVEFSDLKPGDLIFYYRGSKIGHVTMYIGDGMCVHARGSAYGVCITKYDYSKPAWAMRILE